MVDLAVRTAVNDSRFFVSWLPYASSNSGSDTVFTVWAIRDTI